MGSLCGEGDLFVSTSSGESGVRLRVHLAIREGGQLRRVFRTSCWIQNLYAANQVLLLPRMCISLANFQTGAKNRHIPVTINHVVSSPKSTNVSTRSIWLR